MTRLLRLADRAASVQLQIAGLAVLAIFLNITADVVMRALFNAPIGITFELVSFYYMIPLTFLPMMALEVWREHIDTDLFYRMFPVAMKRISQMISGVITIGIYGLLARFTFEQAIKSTKAGEVAMGINAVPIWPVRWVLPVVFALATVAAVLVTIHYIMGRDDDA